jgi:tRNA pseudouridine38-40 synthase
MNNWVRKSVGSLVWVGGGERPVAWIAELLEGRDRTIAGPTAPSAGLLFLGPKYPRHWGLPDEVCADE